MKISVAPLTPLNNNNKYYDNSKDSRKIIWTLKKY